MIIDTSAAIALLRAEPEASAMQQAMSRASRLGMSAASVLELSIVTAASGSQLVDAFLSEVGVDVVAVDHEHLKWARLAHARYGRGSGSQAKLNFGDCLA